MHGTPFAGAQRPGRTCSRRLRTRTLKNGLPGHGPSGRGPRAANGTGLRSRRGGARRSLVYRARSGLRHNHARCGWLRRGRYGRQDWTRRSRWNWRRGRRGREHCRWRYRDRTRWRCRRCRQWRGSGSHGSCGLLQHRRDNRRFRGMSSRSRSRSRFRRRRRDRGLCCDGRMRDGRTRRRGMRSCALLLLGNGSEHVSRPGDV